MTRDIIQRWQFPHPPELIWEFLTDPVLLAQWLSPNNFRAELGYEFRFDTQPKVKMGFDGIIYCKVMEMDAPRRLTYSWKGGPRPGTITLDSVVSWTLTANVNGTELLLEHTGFQGMKNYLTYLVMNKGWQKISKRLGSKLNQSANYAGSKD